MTTKNNNPASIKFHLPAENKELLQLASIQSGVIVSEIIRRLVENFLNSPADQTSKLLSKSSK